jgi:hypothetical protein
MIDERKVDVISSCHTVCTISWTSSSSVVPRPLMENKKLGWGGVCLNNSEGDGGG